MENILFSIALVISIIFVIWGIYDLNKTNKQQQAFLNNFLQVRKEMKQVRNGIEHNAKVINFQSYKIQKLIGSDRKVGRKR